MNNITADGLAGADEVIKAMQRMGHDYSAHRDRIALELFENGVWDGNYDSTIEFEDGLPALRLIQEDEYDQSMDEDEKPDWDDQIDLTRGGYLFLA
jgi:hypothetical protein